MNRVCFVYCVVGVLTISAVSRAAILFESGTLGPTGLTFDDFGGTPEPSGAFVSDFAFTGIRFELTQPAVMKRVGGHFVVDPGHDDSFFGVIVRLNDATDFPDSGDLSTPDVVGQTLLSFPNTSAEVFGDLELPLGPGWYALVFGSGLFGATGRGAALANNPDIGTPSYIAFLPNSQWVDFSTLPGPFENFRLVVEGYFVPEPNSIIATLVALASLRCFFRNRRCVTPGPA
jgi:hypothetical protein